LTKKGVAMSKQKNLPDIFNRLSEYVGLAIQIVRVASRMEKIDLAEILRERFNWGDDAEDLIDRAERQAQKITFGQFENICFAIGQSTEVVLKCAVSLKSCEGMPEREILQKVIDEFGFLICRQI
jgi:hypothetical protein